MAAPNAEESRIVPYRSYEEIVRLNADTQRQLLQHGDPVERVWAAWAMGVTLGRESTPELMVGLQESPAAGTRRHLLVVLAGLGEREVLRVFAQDDPDDFVRATACRYLIRISGTSENSVDQFLQERLLRDPSPIARQAILTEAPMGLPFVRLEDLALLARDANLDVRQAAIDRLLETKPLQQLFPGVLEGRIADEDNDVLRQRLLALCLRTGGAARLLELCSTLSSDRSCEILRLLIEAKSECRWEQLSPLSTATEPERDHLLIQLLQPDSIPPAVAWLLRGIARAATWPHPRNRQESEVAFAVRSFGWNAKQLLLATPSDLTTVDRTDLDQTCLETVAAQLRDEIAQIEWELENDEWEGDVSGQQAIDARRELVDVLTRMALGGQ
jgi:hypothetical protein